MKQLLVICGPTASSKTSLALNLAKKFNGELVNADSRQVYRGMDIGTGKELDKSSTFHHQFLIKNDLRVGYYLFSNIPVWLLDIVDPDYRFSVADYLKTAVPTIENIWFRKKLPILVGGTGFYIKALIEGVDTAAVGPDWALRKKLERLDITKLQQEAKKINPDRFNKMNQSDRHNPRRLIRVIEIGGAEKDHFLSTSPLNLKKEDLLLIGLKMPLEKLDQRIKERVKKRIDLGLIAEIKRLLTRYDFDNSVLGETIAYKEWSDYFKISGSQKDRLFEEAITRWERAECQYARRQMTWFKKNQQINWFRADQDNLLSMVANKAKRWYIRKR